MEKGYGGTDALEIERSAKVSKRELYQVCSDKSALLKDAITEGAQRMRLPLELPAATDRAVLAAALTALGTSVLRGVSKPPVLGRLSTGHRRIRHAAEVAHALATARAAGRAALARMLTQAQADGLIGAGDPATMAVEGFALLWGDLLLATCWSGGAAQIADAGTEGARGDEKSTRLCIHSGAARGADGRPGGGTRSSRCREDP